MNYIMVSAHNEKHLSKINSLDGIIMLNLEDGVPEDKKEIALQNIINYLENNNSKNIVVRTNSLTTSGLYEIEKLKKFDIKFRIPKINNLEELNAVFRITSNEIHLSIETKESFFNLKNLKHPQVSTFYLGILDLFDELKLDHSLISFENQLIHKILIDFSLNCRFIGVNPIGFVYQYYKDLDGFKKWCEFQKNYGFLGVGCITPTQLEISNQIFSQFDIKSAKIIVERFEKEGAFTLNGLFVDEPIYKNAKLRIENETIK